MWVGVHPLNLCVLSEAAQGRGSDIEDGLNPVLHSSGRPWFIRVRIIPPQDQRKRILNKSSCWGENAIVRVQPYVLYVCVCARACTLTCCTLTSAFPFILVFLLFFCPLHSQAKVWLAWMKSLCSSLCQSLRVCVCPSHGSSPDCLPLRLSLSHPCALSVTDFDGFS